MSILKHPLLLSLATLVEQERTAFKWIDLYAAQFIADSYVKTDIEKKPSQSANGMADLFDGLPDAAISINESDIIVLALMCSQFVSQGETHLKLSSLPQDLITSAKACGYRPSYNPTQDLLDGLGALGQINILRVATSDVTIEEKLNNNAIPLEDKLASNQSPLILFQDKLYLAKYWSLHQTFESWLQSRRHYIEPLHNDLLEGLSGVLNKVFSIGEGKLEDEVKKIHPGK